ncbi:MAG TPA: hypothetical protein VMR81_04730 [Patescibacteria group bacterium]|nr:hypothetical protein [Patescibacteria group bacterium]
MLTLILLAELIVLYFLSRWVTQSLFTFFLLLFRSRPVAVSILLVLEFPGTAIHELSHLFTAEILGVKTGKLSLEPESIRGPDITSGSVMIAETDPFRRYAIGLAPIFSGIIALTAISYFTNGLWTSVFSSHVVFYQNADFYLLLLIGYCLFAVSNTMFSSPADLKGFIPFCIVLTVFVVALYFTGIRIVLTGFVLEEVTRVVTTLVSSLGIVLAINAGLLVVAWALRSVLQKIMHLQIV